MNAPQYNAHKMGQSVSSLLEILTATNESPALRAKAVGLKTHLSDIKSLSATQATPFPGQTRDRNRLFDLATTATVMVAGPVLSYAQGHQLGDLIAKVDLTRTDFQSGRFNRRLELMQQVHDAAAGALPRLADYPVTAEMLADLQAKIGAASDVALVTRTNAMSRRVATEKLAETFRKMRKLIADEIDPLIEPLAASDPDNYALYQAARVVIDLPGTPDPTPANEPAPAPAANPNQLAA